MGIIHTIIMSAHTFGVALFLTLGVAQAFQRGHTAAFLPSSTVFKSRTLPTPVCRHQESCSIGASNIHMGMTDKEGKRLPFWNYNEVTRSPYGFSENGEIWNSRLAMLSFVYLFIQEAIMGEGVIQSVQKGNVPIGTIIFGVLISAFSVVYAIMAAREDADPAVKWENPYEVDEK